MDQQRHQAFVLAQKEQFKKQMSDTFFDLTDHSNSSAEFEHKLTNERWLGWLDHAFSSLNLENDCMIDQTWFMKGTPVSALIKHAENVYKAEAVAQNSKIEFGTDDNQIWWAHEVPFFGTVQMDRIEEHGVIEWDIYFNKCWQGPFGSKARCVQHLEECIKEKREEEEQSA